MILLEKEGMRLNQFHSLTSYRVHLWPLHGFYSACITIIGVLMVC